MTFVASGSFALSSLAPSPARGRLLALTAALILPLLLPPQNAPLLPPPRETPTDPHTLAVRNEINADNAGFVSALRNRDTSYFERIWAPELLVNSPGNRILTRSEVITALMQGKLDYRDTHTIPESFFTTGDYAVSMGHEDYVPLSGPEAGKTLYRRFTNFYIHREGHWVMLARQATIYDPSAVHYTPAAHPDPSPATK